MNIIGEPAAFCHRGGRSCAADPWGIGRKGIDGGPVLVVASNERQGRIEVGNGLVNKLDDAMCRRIIVDAIVPGVAAGDLPDGIAAGTAAIIAALAAAAPA